MRNGTGSEHTGTHFTNRFTGFLRLLHCVSRRQLCVVLLASGLFLHGSAFALLPFPLSAGQRGIVTCLDNPAISYDIFLPSGYTTNSSSLPLPIVYTFSPNGGGYINQYQNVCSNLQMIAVGIIGFRNNVDYETILREIHAVTRDIRQRVLFDGTAEIMSGFSGGGMVSYTGARFRPQYVAGVYDMAGTMGRGLNGRPLTDQVQTNLFVARSRGTTDAPADFYFPADSNYLASCGAIVKDWTFSGGHQSSPDSIKTPALQWIMSQSRQSPMRRIASVQKLGTWRSRLAAGEKQEVMQEAVHALINEPRTWNAYHAQIVVDELIASGEFHKLDFKNLAAGNFAFNHFYFSAYGAALNGDWNTYHASLKALTGVTNRSIDRSAGLSYLLDKFGFPAPTLQCTENSGRIHLRFRKDAPGLIHLLQSRTNLLNDAWREEAIPTFETDTTWSTATDLLAGPVTKFYRIKAVPAPAGEPFWP